MNAVPEHAVVVEFQTESVFSQSAQTSVGTTQPESEVSTVERTTGRETDGLAGGSWALGGQQL